MKHLTLVLLAMLTYQEMIKECAWEAIHTIDYFQTSKIAKHPEDYYERYNPILGEHPTTGEVNTWFLSTTVLHPLITLTLPNKEFTIFGIKTNWRSIWQNTTIGISSGLVINNFAVGIHF